MRLGLPHFWAIGYGALSAGKISDEMVDWELDWLPRKELNIKFEYKSEYVRIVKDAVDEEDLVIYEYF